MKLCRGQDIAKGVDLFWFKNNYLDCFCFDYSGDILGGKLLGVCFM